MRTATFLPTITLISSLVAAEFFHDVTQSRFEALLQDNSLLLTAFTSRTLESLESFHEIFAKAATNVSTPLATIDCDRETELCNEQDINVYPTIRLLAINEGHELQVIRYRGRRTKNAIRSFVRRHELPVLSHIQAYDIQAFKTIDDIVVIAYLRPDEEELLRTFRYVAEGHDEYVFGFVTDAAIADAEDVAMSSIVCYKNLDGDHRSLGGHFSEADVESFLKTASKYAVKEFKERDVEDFMLPGKLTTYIFTTSEEDATTIRHELTPLANKYEKFVTFAIASTREYALMAKNFGINMGLAFPTLVVHAPMNDDVFSYQQGKEVVAGIVEAMLTTILHGKATSGQVFGDEAPEIEEDSKDRDIHTEL
ncbi:Nn.00g063240.m01.CDS01 [Neocucurbitaria sp. VM-36]